MAWSACQVNCDSKTSRKIQQGSLTDLRVALILPSKDLSCKCQVAYAADVFQHRTLESLHEYFVNTFGLFFCFANCFSVLFPVSQSDRGEQQLVVPSSLATRTAQSSELGISFFRFSKCSFLFYFYILFYLFISFGIFLSIVL